MRRALILASLLIAAPATADEPVGTTRSLVVHVPPGSAIAGAPIELAAMIDAPLAEALVVRWRVAAPRGAWQAVAFERSSAGGWYAVLPPSQPPGVEYYIAGAPAAGAERTHFASAAAPHLVRVEPTVSDRLERLDRDRLGDLRNEIAFDVDGHDFGNRYGILDRFLRAEAKLTRRMWTTLHEVHTGFGAIEGATPQTSMPGSPHVDTGLRYGFGGARVRLHPVVFIDGRVMLGVSHDGFAGGASGAVTFGRPWRSNVSVGGEALTDLGPSAYIRLQWDTAPPLLMAASIVRSDLPGAVISQDGLYVKYEVIYRAIDRATLRGSLSFGSRDGPAHFGGGLGAGLDF